jgi:hypothetical protein
MAVGKQFVVPCAVEVTEIDKWLVVRDRGMIEADENMERRTCITSVVGDSQQAAKPAGGSNGNLRHQR